MAEQRVICAIPARWASERLPGKPLLELAGRPMIQHVWDRACEISGVDRVVVLTDDQRIADVVSGFGGECELTPEECTSGTDRIAWAARQWRCDAVVNLQGDEPLIDPREVGNLVRHLTEHGEAMVTLATRVDAAELDDPNRVKVVLDRRGYALYFSRAGIPYPRGPVPDGKKGHTVWRHVGIYGYQRSTLLELAELEPTPLELSERLEQLRALENGIRIRILEAREAPIGVDTQADLAVVTDLMRANASG